MLARSLALATLAAALAQVARAEEKYETVVTAPAEREPGQFNVSTEDLRQAPGAQGDAGKALENLPGVARPALSGGELVVWGAAPGDTRVVVDGIEIPRLYHLGGMRSVLSSGFLRGLSLVPGGFGADYGRGLGGLVRIDTRAPPFERYQGEVDVDVLDASFAAGSGVGHGGGFLAAGRWGYLDRILQGALSSDTRRLFPLPRYHDFQGKVVIPLRDDEKLDVIYLTAADASAIANHPASPSFFAEQNQHQSFTRLGVRYVRVLPDGSALSLTPFIGWGETETQQRSGLTSAGEATSSMVLGLRGHYVAPLSAALTMLVGFDGLLTLASVRRSGSPTIPPREGDIMAFGQPLSGVASTDSWSASLANLAPYASLEIVRGRWRMTPSFRFDGDVVAANRRAPGTEVTPQVGTSRLSWSPAPRFVLAHQSSSWLSGNLALGLFQQAPNPADLSAVFGSPTLGVEHALHAVAGAELAARWSVSVQPTLFYRHMWNLVMRNPNPSPPLAQALVQDGVGRVYGAQVLVRVAPRSALSGWLAYTLSRSERRHAADSSYRLFDQDQPHVLTAVANARLGGFVVSTRFRLATGMPRTPVVGSYLDTSTGQYHPLFGQHNAIRLPVFYALDLRVERRFHRRALDCVPYMEVLNLTNHANAEQFAYDERFASRSNITGLPILAVAGVSVRF